MAIPEARLKFYRRVRDLRHVLQQSADDTAASKLILSVAIAWQEISYPRLRACVRRPYGTAQYSTRTEVLIFAKWLADINDLNVAAYWLASAYALLVGDRRRADASLYFTPPKLAQRVIDGLIEVGASLTNHSWHDPACGGAAFLVPVAQRMAKAFAQRGTPRTEIPANVASRISGTDLEPTLLELSKYFLQMALYDYLEAGSNSPLFDLQIGDGLLAERISKPEVVICNPPYRKLKSSESAVYRSRYKETIQCQPNIYALFIQRSIQLAARDGFIGLLTPTSFLSGQYFSALRIWLLTNSQPQTLEMLSDRKSTFIDVEQETAIMIARPKINVDTQSSKVRLTVRSSDGSFAEIGQCTLPACGQPWPIPKRVDDIELIIAAAKCNLRLPDYGYSAKIGHLVDYRDTRLRMKDYPESSISSAIFPLVWATDITPVGKFEHGRRRQGARQEHYVQLDPTKLNGLVRSPALLMQRVTSTDQPRRLVCAVVPPSWLRKYGGLVAENHVIVIEPTEKNSAAIPPALLAEILRSEAVDRLFRSISGAANVSIFELSQMPLPDLNVVQRELAIGSDIEMAVRRGYGISHLKTVAA